MSSLIPITDLAELNESANNLDVLPIVDTSDTSMYSTGTNKFITVKNLINKKISEIIVAEDGLISSYNPSTGVISLQIDPATITLGENGIAVSGDPRTLTISLSLQSLTEDYTIDVDDKLLFYDNSASINKSIEFSDLAHQVKLPIVGAANDWSASQTFLGSGAVIKLKHSSVTTGNLYMSFRNAANAEMGYVGYGSALNEDFTIANGQSSNFSIYSAGSNRFVIKSNAEINLNTTKVEILGTNPELNIGSDGGGNRSTIRLNGEALFSYKASDNFLSIGSSDASITAPIKLFASLANPTCVIQKNGTVEFPDQSGTVTIKIDNANSRININGPTGSAYKGDLVFGGYSSVGSLPGGAGFFMGTAVATSSSSNTLTKTSSDFGHYFYTRYDRGLELHTGVSGALGSTFNDATNTRLRVDANGYFIYPSNSSSTPLTKITVRGSKLDLEPNIFLVHDTDDSTGKSCGISTRARMTNRYLATYLNAGQNDTSFGTPGVISFTALEYSNSSYTTLAAPTEFSGWNFQYYTGSAYSSVFRVHTSGIGIGTTSPTAKLDINGDTIRLRTSKTPATASSAGNAGDIAWDANYLYVCVATNTWKRSALSTW